jgi:hypothetical protein
MMNMSYIFVNKMVAAMVWMLNVVENIRWTEYLEPSDLKSLIKCNLIDEDGRINEDALSAFILNDMKEWFVKPVLYEMENVGMELSKCWEVTTIERETLTNDEVMVVSLIESGRITKFAEVFDVFRRLESST